MSSIENLVWDSAFFKKRIGRLILKNAEEFDTEQFWRNAQNDYDLVYVISNYKLIQSNSLCKFNLDLIDILITMSLPLSKVILEESKYCFRTELSEEEINDCYKIAEQTSMVSRFNNEPLIGSDLTKKLYRKWIDNALNQSFCDGLFIEKINRKIIGIHLIKTIPDCKTGFCFLIGVDNDYRRMGIGRKLWNQAFAYWADLGTISKVQVPFSLQNIESVDFHLKLGFKKVEEIRYIYHFRNRK